MLEKLRQLSPLQRESEAEAVSVKLRSLSQWGEAKNILGYMPLPEEFPLLPILKLAHDMGKAVYLPRIEKESNTSTMRFLLWTFSSDELECSAFGLYTPCDGLPEWNAMEDMKSLILVPGLAFTPHGLRLGRGGGFYDSFLKYHSHLYSVAPCFNVQIYNQIPVLDHDQTIRKVIFS